MKFFKRINKIFLRQNTIHFYGIVRYLLMRPFLNPKCQKCPYLQLHVINYSMYTIGKPVGGTGNTPAKPVKPVWTEKDTMARKIQTFYRGYRYLIAFYNRGLHRKFVLFTVLHDVCSIITNDGGIVI